MAEKLEINGKPFTGEDYKEFFTAGRNDVINAISILRDDFYDLPESEKAKGLTRHFSFGTLHIYEK